MDNTMSSSNNKRQKSDASKNRKSAQANRAQGACETCRVKKTRCFRDPELVACMRCRATQQICSFEREEMAHQSIGGPVIPTTFQLGSDMKVDKLDSIQRGINEVLNILKKDDLRYHRGNTNDMMDVEYNNSANLGNMLNINTSNVGGPKASNNPHATKSVDDNLTFQTPTNSFETSAYLIVTNQILSNFIPTPILDLLGLNSSPRNKLNEVFNDVISKGIISEADAIDLMNDFRRNYGRWILFPLSMSSSILLDRIRYKSTLLLTTCFCLSLRYSLNGVIDPATLERKRAIHRLLVQELAKDMGNALMKFTCFSGADSGHIEFMQALVLLSIYALSLSSMAKSTVEGLENQEEDLKLDAWLLSGLGLKMFVTKSSFGSLLRGSPSRQQRRLKEQEQLQVQLEQQQLHHHQHQQSQNQHSIVDSSSAQSPFTIFYDELDLEEFQKLAVLRTYNHLTLVHLINCIFSGRMCIIDSIRLKYSSATLSLPSSTNFDGRMVSEIGILLVAYNYIQENLCNGNNEKLSLNERIRASDFQFAAIKEEIRNWYEQWEYLFSQPAPQFVELCYHFCCVMIYYAHTYQRAIMIEGFPAGTVESMVANLYNESNVVFLLKHADDNSLNKILLHAINLVRFVNVIESDSYFAYLLDQIHFCFFFAGVLILRLYIENENPHNNIDRAILTKREITEIKGDITLLILKFRMMSNSTNSPGNLTSRYMLGLESLYIRVYGNS